ncbi:MAG: ABC transporter ATP-binding protein [Myxococcota bacterium]
MKRSSLSLSGIDKRLGGQPILRGVELEVEEGALVVLVGPSGCGKSTLLRVIAGLETPDAGTVHIGEQDVTALAPGKRDVAMVFQSYALYPHLTVRDNLAFGLTLRKTPKSVVSERIREVSGLLGLGKLLLRYPRELSGGQRQRVAMGRAIARRPKLFLFDEPLSNLDAALRTEVRVEIKRLHAQLGTTMVYVTHDQVEAMTLADHLVVMREGVIQQQGPPLEVYAEPTNRFVGGFVGSPSMNFLEVEGKDGVLTAADVAVPWEGADGKFTLGVRPQVLELSETEEGPIRLTVDVVESMGFEAYVHGRVGDVSFVARVDGDRARAISPGTVLHFRASTEDLRLFDEEGNAR